MEKGEVGILAVQAAALIIVILLLSNFTIGADTSATTSINNVYWGGPTGGVALSKGTTNSEMTNASTISVFYGLAFATAPASISAVRLCLNPQANNTGGTQVYTNIQLNYSSKQHSNYISFGPTEQKAGQICTYTIQLTDSVQTTVTWVATVKVVGNSTT